MDWNYFISHASEDKPLVAAPLAHYFRSVGFKIWYDDFSLRVGDSILGEINRGLGDSDFGIVILSPAFFSKPWPKRELAALIATAGDGRVLPVWHQVTAADVAHASPILADIKAISTARGLNAVAESLIRASYPRRLKSLPISNYAEETERGRAEGMRILSDLLQGNPGRDDVFLVLSAYQSLIARLAGYDPQVVPASQIEKSIPCDFALVVPHGITGPIQLILVVLGATDADLPRGDFVTSLAEQYGPASAEERPAKDYLGTPLVREFPRVHDFAERLRDHVESENFHVAQPQGWSFSVLLFYGRRRPASNPMTKPAVDSSPGRLSVEIASYDRLTDERVMGLT